MHAPRPAYLAIDQGGHASRALVFDDTGTVIARGLHEVREHRPAPGRVEQDPEELVASVRVAAGDAVREAGGQAPRLRAGLATQRSSIVCWDRVTGEALSPVLSWQDRRAHRWLERLAGQADAIHRKTGLRLTAHYGGSKMRWCLEHLPRVRKARERGRLCCGPLAAFLAFRILDERPLKVDPANAARTLLWSLDDLTWDPDLLELFEVPWEILPACVPTVHDFGRLGPVPLTLVTGDQSAALFAHGKPEDDTAYVNLGTGAFVQRVARARPAPCPGLLTGVVLQDGPAVTYVLEGTVNGAGSALSRIAGRLGVSDVDDRLAGWLERAGDPPLFLNGVSGLGSPYWIPDFRSRFVGDGEPWEKMAAVAESIVFLLSVNLERLREDAPPLRRLVATGGLAWNGALCRRLADLAGLPVDRPEEHEATARGTACLLAGQPPRWAETPVTRFDPREDPALDARYRRWREELDRAVARPEP